MAAEYGVLQEQVKRIGAAAMHGEVLAAIERLLEDHPRLSDEREVAIPGGSVTWKDLQHYRTWNSAAPGRGSIRALDFERENHPYGIILSYARQLAERDIEFLVVPVPTRIQIYPERLPGVEPREEFAGGSPGTARLLLALAGQGVEIVDLLSVFGARRNTEGDPLYHDFDVHWTPCGVSLAADVIAARIKQMDWFEPGALEPGVDFDVVHERGPYELYA